MKQNNPTHKHYWIAQGFSEKEASQEIRKRHKKCKEYWIERGFSEEDAIKNANTNGKLQNKGSKQYWINKFNYDENTAIKNANEYNKKSKIFGGKTLERKNNILCIEYWQTRYNLTEDEAKVKIKEENHKRFENLYNDPVQMAKNKLKGNFNMSAETKTNMVLKITKKLKEKNRTHSPIFLEYWIKARIFI